MAVKRWTVVGITGIALLVGLFFGYKETSQATGAPRSRPPATAPTTLSTAQRLPAMMATAIPSSPVARPTILGYSTGGLPLYLYTFGTGPARVALVGGIHANEWNTILLAYAAIDYFTQHPTALPAALTLHIVPTANPDGQRLVTGGWGRFQADAVTPTVRGRFNQHGVDLNRNWDCAWSAEAWWGTVKTSGGSAPFSEKETQLLRDFLLADWQGRGPVRGAVFWHSAAPGVFAGGCTGKDWAAERLAATYAGAAGYPYGKSFTSYPITGDATNWLATQGIPAIIVELATNDSPEWPQNQAGMLATLAYLAEREQRVWPTARNEEAPSRQFAR